MVGQQRIKEASDETNSESGGTTNASPESPKARLAMLKRSSTKSKVASSNDPFRFQGDGVDFNGKLIGVRDVDEPRGDAMCAEAMRLAKAAVKSAGQHKQRIILNISIEGIKIKDAKSQTTLHNFPVSRISFIARDTTDARAFGFIFGCADNKYKFYGIKTAQTADRAVLSIRDMFQIVFEMKKAHLAQVKQKQEEQQNKDSNNADGVRIDNGVAVADLLDLECELHNIEQGVNQLQNIPAFAEDSWPTAADSFGVGSQPPFGASSPPNLSLQSSSLFEPSDPFGDSFNPRAPTTTGAIVVPPPPPVLAQNPQPAVHTQLTSMPATSSIPSFHLPPPQVQPLQPSNPWSQINTVHSAPNFHSMPFSETNPFAPSVRPSSDGLSDPSDPFDTLSAQRLIDAAGRHTNSGFPSWPTNENSAPFSHNSNSRSSSWVEPRKVTSLEEAFSKLVDMDALVKSPEAKKNPFDKLIHPPKVPIASMGPPLGTGALPPCIPARSTAPPLVFPGANNDPFNDVFFS